MRFKNLSFFLISFFFQLEVQLRKDDVDVTPIPCFCRPSSNPSITSFNPMCSFVLPSDPVNVPSLDKKGSSSLSEECDASTKSVTQGLESHYYTWITHKEKKDQFCDEIEIVLPTLLTPDHHFLVTIYTLTGSTKRSIFGYVVIPILSERNSLIPNGLSSFPVYSKLSDRYLSVSPEASQFHDNKKTLFSFRTHTISSVYTSDATLGRFFSYLETENQLRSDAESISLKGSTLECIDTLGSADPASLFQFLPIVLDNLIEVVRRGGREAAEKALFAVFAVLDRIRRNFFVGNLNSFLKSYIWYWFLPSPRPIPQFATQTNSSKSSHPPDPSHPGSEVGKEEEKGESEMKEKTSVWRDRSPPPQMSGNAGGVTESASQDKEIRRYGGWRDRSPPRMEVGRTPIVVGSGMTLQSVTSSSTTSSGIASRIISCFPPYLYLPLVSAWLSLLESPSLSPSGSETWFILDLMLKNMILYVISIEKASSSPNLDRSTRFPPEFCDKLERVMTIILQPSRFTRGHYGIALASRLIENLLQVYDRGRLFTWLRHYIQELDHTDRFSAKIKFHILRTLVDDRAFLPLNLPIQTPIKSISALQTTYWKVRSFDVAFIISHTFIYI